MILSEVSGLDCLVFLIFLIPQLVIRVGLFTTTFWLVRHAVAIVLGIPLRFLRDRYRLPPERQPPFVRISTPFQDFVIRCVKYAFANLPAQIGRIFFSKEVALPFLRFRMLRHGYLTSPYRWKDISRPGFRALLISTDESKRADILVYYCHGGGFSMGSSYFYMEFLIAWVSLLRGAGYKNPALLSVEYSLVPDAVYPTQVQEALAGYQYALSLVESSSQICVGGDSAGGTLVLSLLHMLSSDCKFKGQHPGFAVLISPWVSIISDSHRNTSSDYLDTETLHLYGSQYLGPNVSPCDPQASPGHCTNLNAWSRASPSRGWLFLFGSEEVLGPNVKEFIALLRKAHLQVDVMEEKGHIHAWPVASLYLGSNREARLHGLKAIVKITQSRIQ